jgi:hypothetical protein
MEMRLLICESARDELNRRAISWVAEHQEATGEEGRLWPSCVIFFLEACFFVSPRVDYDSTRHKRALSPESIIKPGCGWALV